jgi:hypothetical protein
MDRRKLTKSRARQARSAIRQAFDAWADWAGAAGDEDEVGEYAGHVAQQRRLALEWLADLQAAAAARATSS